MFETLPEVFATSCKKCTNVGRKQLCHQGFAGLLQQSFNSLNGVARATSIGCEQ
ncbi:MAG: hypothetical protein KA435_00345 [Azonexus sp.]|nr:hypothetical protein [Azonexus sp.]